MMVHWKKRFILFLVLCSAINIRSEVADLVIFSYDRPLQLYALLESVEKHLKGVGETTVIYRASNKAHYKFAYETLIEQFPQVKFLMQGADPREDFKQLTLQATFESPSKYVLFAVDDIVVKDDADLSYCIEMLERTGAYGFFLRLGDHLDFCYPLKRAQRVPKLTHVQNDVYSWVFAHGEHDWGYPHTVDMTVFRKKDIEHDFKRLHYYSPNTLEGAWASVANPIIGRRGLCFKNTKIVNLPLNRVQDEFKNNCMQIEASELLIQFLLGKKLDIAPLFQIKNKSAHMEYQPTFVERVDRRKAIEEFKQAVVADHPEFIEEEKSDATTLVVKRYPEWIEQTEPLEEKHMVIVTASYKNAEWYKWNLDSVFDQKYENWHMIYVDDCSPDGTGELVRAYVKERGFEHKVTMVCNTVRRKAMANLHTAICMCAPTDVVVILDGDDRLAFDKVLKCVNQMYANPDVWITYGQYKEYPGGGIGFCRDYPREVVESNTFRYFQDGPSHLRTFYAGLFHKIQVQDLMYEGDFFPMTYDLAMMFPMLEMAGAHYKFCPVPLLDYNTTNPISDHRVSQQLQRLCDCVVRSRARYEKIESPF